MRTTVVLLGLAVTLSIASTPALAQPAGSHGTVKGTVTTNGQKVPLVLTYSDETDDDVIIVLASKEVPSDAVPFIGEEVARKFKIHAVVVTVVRATKALGQGLNGLYYPGPEMGYVALAPLSITLQVKRMDATGIEARIFTPKPVTSSDLTYSFDATFSVPLGKAVPPPQAAEIKVSGDVTSGPTSIYADYYRAVHLGNETIIRSFLAAASAKEFDAMDPKTRQMMLGILRDNPPEIRIGKPVIKGRTATFTVEGLNLPTTKASAQVTMVQEGGAWKIEKEHWTGTSK